MKCSVAALAARAPYYQYVIGDIASRETAGEIFRAVGTTPLGLIYASNIEHYQGQANNIFVQNNSINSSRTKQDFKKSILALMSPSTVLISGPLNMISYGSQTEAADKWLTGS